MSRVVSIRVDEALAGGRLDAIVARAAGVSRAVASEMAGAGGILVDGSPRSKAYRPAIGERIDARLPEPPAPAAVPHIDIDVRYDDEHLAVVDKPPGLVVHGGRSVAAATLVDVLAGRGMPLAPRAGPHRPGIVHRLDKDVSGLLVVAKTDEAHEVLVEAMAGRRIRREYLALVKGNPTVDGGKIDAPVGRSTRHPTRMAVVADGREAVTFFDVVQRLGDVALLRVRLQTGRTHQIRTHLAAIGHHVVGDAAYGHDPALARRLGLRRPFLHAARLSFRHPSRDFEVDCVSRLPDDLADVLARAGGVSVTEGPSG